RGTAVRRAHRPARDERQLARAAGDARPVGRSDVQLRRRHDLPALAREGADGDRRVEAEGGRPHHGARARTAHEHARAGRGDAGEPRGRPRAGQPRGPVVANAGEGGAALLALIGCMLVASSIGQLAKELPSAGGLYSYVANALGPQAGVFVGWCYLLFQPLVAPLLFLIFAWATRDVVASDHHGLHWHYTGQWWIWVVLAASIVFFLTYRDVRLSTQAGVVLGIFEIVVFVAL